MLDTSVAIAWYLPETFSARAREWQAELLEGRARLLTPSLHFWEMANVLRTYVRRGELSRDDATEVYDLHLLAPIETVEPSAQDVLATALEYDATAYDAVYIALGNMLEIPILTAERTTTPWVTKLGERVVAVR